MQAAFAHDAEGVAGRVFRRQVPVLEIRQLLPLDLAALFEHGRRALEAVGTPAPIRHFGRAVGRKHGGRDCSLG
ncbi:MAG: hypothetical protein F4089_15270 [Gammaproteobacteria bacterium]|nr:hypothetical protein [Gammaproteobacteria bacterium]